MTVPDGFIFVRKNGKPCISGNSPGWQISNGCYEALLEKGYWVADHVYNDDRRPKELPVYKLDHPWCIHGHTWDIMGVSRDQQNGIRQMIEERGLKFTEDTNFHFIDDIIYDRKDDSNKSDQIGLHPDEPTDSPQVQRHEEDESDSGGPEQDWRPKTESGTYRSVYTSKIQSRFFKVDE